MSGRSQESGITVPASRAAALTVRFPLWLKLGTLFGGLFGLAVAVYGAWDWSVLVAQEEARRAGELEALAEVIAQGVDASAHSTFANEADRMRPEFRQIVVQLQRAMDQSEQVTWGGTSVRDDKGHWHYVVDGSRTAPYPVGYPIFDGEGERNQALAGRVLYFRALEDEAGRWHTVFAPIRTPDGAVVGLVELISDADRASLVLAGQQRRTMGQFALAVLGGLVASFVFGRVMSRHLGNLVVGARSVASGRLDTRVEVRTRDEIGVLAHAFNQMVAGLEEREFIRDTFGRFVNPEVVSQILEDRTRLQLGGESRPVTVLMSDLRGFTALSEDLGPERMVAMLNRYLSRMTDIVAKWDGNVSELLGDGMVVLFGAPVARDDDARRAVCCAIEMQRELLLFNHDEGRHLQMGIGIDSGRVIAGNIGSQHHMKYGVVGAAINVAARLESFTLGNQVLVTEACRAAAGPELAVDEPMEFRAKGRREPLRAYPVRRFGELAMPEDGVSGHVDLEATATAWRVHDKQVDSLAHACTVVRIEAEALTLRTDVKLSALDKVKLEVDLEGTLLQDLYGTVEGTTDGRVLVRLSAVPEAARDALEALISERAGEATGPRLA